jgi:Domain of unknown function (DUF4293)
MIQRVQTLYLAIAIILLSLVTFGTTLFSFVNETSRFTFSSYGIIEYGLNDGKLVNQTNFPFYIGTIALILLSFICLMSYKNLKRQFKLGRLVFSLYFVMLVSVFVLSMYGDAMLDVETTGREMGVGFFLFVAGFPFSFLANTGIKRDRRLLDSLDRLR